MVKHDVAFSDIYYNDAYAWAMMETNIDVESVAVT